MSDLSLISYLDAEIEATFNRETGGDIELETFLQPRSLKKPEKKRLEAPKASSVRLAGPEQNNCGYNVNVALRVQKIDLR